MPTTCSDDDGGLIAVGHAVCVSGWDGRPKVKRALAANLSGSNAKTVLGVVTTVGAGSVDVLVAGEVANSTITGLSTGAGTSRLVVTDFANATTANQCKLRHIDDSPAVGERFVVGSSDENGNVTIQPRHDSAETGFPLVFNVKSYGAKGDGTTDDVAAIRTAIVAAKSVFTLIGNVCGALVYFPTGIYRCASQVLVDGSVILEGAHGSGDFGSSIISFDQDIDGPLINNAKTSTDGSGTFGEWVSLRRLYIRQEDNHARDYSKLSIGIRGAHGLHLEDVFVDGIQGDGVEIDGATQNANDWSVGGHVRITDCDRYGIRVHGQDGSAGSQDGILNIEGSGSFALRDASENGNSYGGIHTAGNGYVVQNGVWVHGGGLVDATNNVWSANKVVTFGHLMLPTVAHKSGFTYRATSIGSPPHQTGGTEPAWPTTQLATITDSDITWLCYAEEGGPYWGQRLNSPKTFKWFYAEGDQAPSRVESQDVILGSNNFTFDPNGCQVSFGFNGAELVPFEVHSHRRAAYDSDIVRPVRLQVGDQSQPYAGFSKWAGLVDDIPGHWVKGTITTRDFWDQTLERWARQAYREAIGPDNAGPDHYRQKSFTEADRGGPMAGAVCFQALWLGGKIGQEQRVTALPANTAAPYAPTYGTGIRDCGMGWGVFELGDLVWNKPIAGRPSVPILWRAKSIGSIDPEAR